MDNVSLQRTNFKNILLQLEGAWVYADDCKRVKDGYAEVNVKTWKVDPNTM